MKVTSRPVCFFRSRLRHLHYGRGNQLKAGGLPVEKRVDWSSVIVARSHGSLRSALRQPFDGLGSPLHSGRAALTAMLRFKSPFPGLPDHRPLLRYVNHLSGIHDFDLVLIISLKLEVIFLRRNSTCVNLLLSTLLATTPIVASVYVYEFWVTLIRDKEVLAQPKLGLNLAEGTTTIISSFWIGRPFTLVHQPEDFRLKEIEAASRGERNGGEWCGGYAMAYGTPHTQQLLTPGAQFLRLGFWGEGPEVWTDGAYFGVIFTRGSRGIQCLQPLEGLGFGGTLEGGAPGREGSSFLEPCEQCACMKLALGLRPSRHWWNSQPLPGDMGGAGLWSEEKCFNIHIIQDRIRYL